MCVWWFARLRETISPMKTKSIYIGIDLATTASKTGCCILAEESDGTLHSLQNELVPRKPASLTRLNTDAIVAGIARFTRAHPESDITVVIDASFYWRGSFKQKVLVIEIAEPPRVIDPLLEYRFRETDRFIMRVTRVMALSVSLAR